MSPRGDDSASLRGDDFSESETEVTECQRDAVTLAKNNRRVRNGAGRRVQFIYSLVSHLNLETPSIGLDRRRHVFSARLALGLAPDATCGCGCSATPRR